MTQDKIAEFYAYCRSIWRDQAGERVRMWASALTMAPFRTSFRVPVSTEPFKPVIFRDETEAAAIACSFRDCAPLTDEQEDQGEELADWLDGNILWAPNDRLTALEAEVTA